MATKSKTTLTEKERDELGINVENPATFPDNISPVLKANLQEEYRKSQGDVAATDFPDATSRQNQMVRERAAADGDNDMQKVLETQQKDAEAAAQKQASTSTATAEPAADTSKQTAQRQNQSASKSQ